MPKVEWESAAPPKPRKRSHCWIVEQYIRGIGWTPCYESDVDATRAWANLCRDSLREKYSPTKFRAKKYVREVGNAG